MKFSSRWDIALLGIAGATVLCAALLGRAQYSPSNSGPLIQNLPNSRQQGLGGSMDNDPLFVEKRLRALNIDRHKSLVSDTDKLLKLARQLDAEIASNPPDELTPEQLHKVAEIEKLARSVKTKMAQSFDGGPRVNQSPIPLGDPPYR
jgi:hypothetical protein